MAGVVDWPALELVDGAQLAALDQHVDVGGQHFVAGALCQPCGAPVRADRWMVAEQSDDLGGLACGGLGCRGRPAVPGVGGGQQPAFARLAELPVLEAEVTGELNRAEVACCCGRGATAATHVISLPRLEIS